MISISKDTSHIKYRIIELTVHATISLELVQ